MSEFRQILVCMRMEDSDRALAKAALIGRANAKVLRALATDRGWLGRTGAPQSKTIYQALIRQHNFSSSYSSVYRFAPSRPT